MDMHEISKLSRKERMRYFEDIQTRDSRIDAKVSEQIHKQPSTKNERDLQHWVERRRQQNADPLRTTPYTGYDHFIAEAEQKVIAERNQATFESSTACITSLQVFDSKLETLRENLSPSELEDLSLIHI